MDEKNVEAATDEVDRNISANRLSSCLPLKSKEESIFEADVTNERGSRWRKFSVLFCLCYNSFWSAACFSLQAPFFPKEAEQKGATPIEYGLVFAVFGISRIVTSPICGSLIVTVSPKFFVTSGTFMESGACILFGFLDRIPAAKTYIGMALAIRIVEGIGAASFNVAKFSTVAEEFPKALGKTFSLLQVFVGLGLIVGPTTGGVLYEAGGFVLPFVVVGGLLWVGSMLLWCLMPDIGTSVLQSCPKRSNMKDFLLNWGIATYSFTIVTGMFFPGFNAATLEPHLRKFELTPSGVGAMFVISGGVYTVTTYVWGAIIDRGVNPFILITFGYFLTSTGFLFIGPAPFIPVNSSVWSVIASLVVISLGTSAKIVPSLVGALKSTLARGFPNDLATYGMVAGLFSTCFALGSVIGSSLGGLLMSTTGYEHGTAILFIEEVLLMVILLIFILREKLKGTPDKLEKTPILGTLSPKERERGTLRPLKLMTLFQGIFKTFLSKK